MRRATLRAVAGAAGRAAVVAAPTILVSLRLESSGPLGLALALGVLLLIALRATVAGQQIVLATVAALLLVAVLIAQAVIVPLGAYLVWLELAHGGAARGAVSYVFVLFTSLFSAVAASAAPERRAFGFFFLGAWAALLVGLVTAADGLFTVSAALALCSLISGRRIRIYNAGVAPSISRFAAIRSMMRRTVGDLARVVTVAAVAAAFAALIAPHSPPRGSTFVDTLLSPGLRAAVLSVYPRFPLLADVPGYGTGLDSRNLDARPLLSEATVYEIDGPANRRIYLRAEVFDRYTGESWRVSDRSDDERKLDADDLSAEGEPNGRDGRIELTVVSDFISSVAHTIDTVEIETDPAIDWKRASFNRGFVPEDPMLRDQQIVLRTERSGVVLRERAADDDEPRDRWLSLPDDLPSVIVESAAILKGDDARATVASIQRFINRGSVYTLEPPRGGSGDFVSRFLEHRQGFCVHFASAFTVLARATGLPARYVTGYLVTTDDRGRGYAGGLNAHAWSEVLIDGTWRIVEATPPMLSTDEHDAVDQAAVAEAADVSISPDGDTLRQLRTIFGDTYAELADRERERRPAEWLLVVMAAMFATAGAAGAAAGFTVWKRSRKAHAAAGPLSRELSRVVAAAPSGADPALDGWRSWRRSIDTSALPLRRTHLDRVVTIALETNFARRAVGGRDRRFLRHVTRRLHKRR